MSKYEILELPLKFDLENKTILKQASLAHRQLAELKGVARTIPNENILISTLTLQEAKDSSEVESIVTTQDDLYRYEIKAENFEKSPASKEVLKYREAIRTGFEKLRKGLLQAVRDSNGAAADWQAWVMFMLKGIEVTAAHTITIVNGINRLMAEYKAVLRPEFGKSYRHELLNHLFYHPYTKIDHTTEALGVTRMTASAYLDKIVKLGLLSKFKVGRVNYYINEKLVDLLVNHENLQIISDMYSEMPFFIQIASDVHSKTAFAIHISTVVYSETPFFMHETSDIYNKTQISLHDNGDLL